MIAKRNTQPDQQAQWDAEDAASFRMRLRDLQYRTREARETLHAASQACREAKAAYRLAQQRFDALLEEDLAGMPLFDRTPTLEPAQTVEPEHEPRSPAEERINLRDLKGITPAKLDAARLAPDRYQTGTLKPVVIDCCRYCVSGSAAYESTDALDESWTLRVLYEVENYQAMHGAKYPLRDTPGGNGREYYTGLRVILSKKKTLVVGPSFEALTVVQMRAK